MVALRAQEDGLSRRLPANPARLRVLWSVAWVVAAASTAVWWLQVRDGLLQPEGLGQWQFAWPEHLWWALLAFVVPVGAAWSLTDLPRVQQALQVALRMGLIAVIAVALAGPRSRQQTPRGVQIIHLVDRSASVPDVMLRQAGAAILADGKAMQADPELRVDVVRFDRQARRLPWPPTATDAAELAGPDLSRDAKTGLSSDLESALNTAVGLVDEGRIVHAVIWSDGIETDGDATELVGSLAAIGVRVHTPKREKSPVAAEFLVERFEVPPKIRSNLPFEAAVHVRATAPATVACSVDGKSIKHLNRTIAVRPGTHRIVLGKLRIRDGGTHQLRVQCKLAEGSDRFAGNNAMRTSVVVHARPRLLYIEGARGQSLYLTRALADDYEVQTRPPDALPRTIGELRRYSAIILSDVARISRAGVPQLTDGDMRNLHAYARAGGGLLVIGGEDSLGSGGYQGTYLDKHVLPVRVEIESEIQQPTIAMVLCIDRSGSMQGTKIELAKEAARATAEALGHDDKIGIFAFDNVTRAVVRLQRAGNRYRIATDIGRLTAGGGTNIYPCLQQAYDALNTAAARVKHVILLSDGKAPRAGIDGLVHQMRRSGMTVTSVGVGAEVDRSLLEAIADRGGGRSYFTDRPETLPRIFVRETKEVSGESVVEKRFRVRRAPGSGRVDMLKGVDLPNAPILLGYLPSKVKPGAHEILRTSTNAPLLVRWRQGLGKVTVWTSDLKNRWAHHWINWPDYAVFARQLIRDLLQEEIGTRVAVAVHRDRSRLRIAVDAVDEDDQFLRDLHGVAKITVPSGDVRRVPLPEVALGRYETSAPLDQVGPYEVRVELRANKGAKPLAIGEATAVHPYPDEYRIASADSTALPGIVKATGGVSGAVAADWRDNRGKTWMRWQWRWPDLVKLALLLLLMDVTLRRIRLGRVTSRSWYDRR